MLLRKVLTNLELSVENLAIRILTREQAIFADNKIPTFLIRTHAISFFRHSDISLNATHSSKKNQ